MLGVGFEAFEGHRLHGFGPDLRLCAIVTDDDPRAARCPEQLTHLDGERDEEVDVHNRE